MALGYEERERALPIITFDQDVLSILREILAQNHTILQMNADISKILAMPPTFHVKKEGSQ